MKEKIQKVSVEKHIEAWKNGKIFLPAFQSGERWDNKRRIAYCQSLINGSPSPLMYIGEKGELVEGQQRTKAIEMAIDGKLGFAQADISTLLAVKLNISYLSNYTKEEVVDFYININNGGVSHNKLEIAKASLNSDDASGFSELEKNPIWEKLGIKESREGVKAILMQALLLIESSDCSVDIGSASQFKLMKSIAEDIKPHTSPLMQLAQSVDYLNSALLHSQKWMKKGQVPFILCLAVEALEQGDSPAIFGGFLQAFYLGELTVMGGKRNNVPMPSSERWSDLASGSGTSKPAEVNKRWQVLINSYNKDVSSVSEYSIPAHIIEAEQKALKRSGKEAEKNALKADTDRIIAEYREKQAKLAQDEKELAEFRAWKAMQAELAQEEKLEENLTPEMLEV